MSQFIISRFAITVFNCNLNKASEVGQNSPEVSQTHHRGTHTLVRVGVLAREVRPWEGNFFHPIMPLIVSCITNGTMIKVYTLKCWNFVFVFEIEKKFISPFSNLEKVLTDLINFPMKLRLYTLQKFNSLHEFHSHISRFQRWYSPLCPGTASGWRSGD